MPAVLVLKCLLNFQKCTIRELDETDWEECKLDIHHVFPQDWCKNHEIGPKQFNSILNKTPISYKANRMIGGKSPSGYLQQLQKHKNVQLDDAEMDAILATHHINPAFLRTDDYHGYIEARRQLLIAEISKVMGKDVIDTGEMVADDEVDDD